MAKLEIYTDGGSRGNPGIGGWGVYSPTENYKACGYKELTTNNEMELTAILEALKFVINSGFKRYDEIVIYSDSSYCVNIFNQWVWTWIKQGILNEKKNSNLISDILLLRRLLRSDEWKITFIKVPGHSGNEGNETADGLVNMAMDTKGTYNFVPYMHNITYYLSLLPYVESIQLDPKGVIHVSAPGYSHSKDGLNSHSDGVAYSRIFDMTIEWSGISFVEGGVKLW